MWNAKKHGKYFVGDAAYGHWIQWLTQVEAGEAADPKGGMQGNGWCFDVLIHSRRIAAGWLRQIAPSFEQPSREQLLLAADHYQKIVDGCLKDLSCPWDLAPGPDHYADWTSAKRQSQISRLESARTQDRAAISALQSALATPRLAGKQ
jgi:hypothetical protein